jgi:phage shock protein C
MAISPNERAAMPSWAGWVCWGNPAGSFGGISQHLAKPPGTGQPLEGVLSANYLKSINLQILARLVLRDLHGADRPPRQKELQVMQSVQPNPFTREDTFFGVCQALGDDFGFSPLWLRIAFAAGLFFNPVAALASYAALGLIVLVTRLVVPNPRVAPAAAEAPAEVPATQAVEAAQLRADNETVADVLAVAA